MTTITPIKGSYKAITGNAWMIKNREGVTNSDMVALCHEYMGHYHDFDANYFGLIAIQEAKYSGRKKSAKAPRRLISETVAVLDTLDHLRACGLLVEKREEGAR